MKTVSEANTILAGLACDFRLKQSSQSPYYQLRGLQPFEDGRTQVSTRIHHSEPNALQRAVELALAFKNDQTFITRKTKTPVFTGWVALTEQLKQHLTSTNRAIHTDYQRHIKELSAFKGPVTAHRLQDWVEAVEPDHRDRERRLITLRRIVEMGFEIEPNWLEQAKARITFNPVKVLEPRDIPTDDQIVSFIDQMAPRTWQVAFGLIATYGLRNHEVFKLRARPDADGWIEVSDDSKTGWRAVVPGNSEWVDRWNLVFGDIPKHQEDMPLRELGKKVSRHFTRHRGLAKWNQPKTYDLRHAFAARLHTNERFLNLEIEQCAKLMGHSEKIHSKTYLRWCAKDDMKRALKKRMGI